MNRILTFLFLLTACGDLPTRPIDSSPSVSPDNVLAPGQGSGQTQHGIPCVPPNDYFVTQKDGGIVHIGIPGTCPPNSGKESPAIDGPDFTHPKVNPGINIPTNVPINPPGDPKL